MPMKPAKPCAFPGCPRLTHGRYCEEHERLTNKQYERYGRDRTAKKRYSSKEWRVLRERYAELHPLCELCLKDGFATPAEHVHHLKPLSEGGTNDFDNLMSLCKSCHSRIHAKRGDRWHDKPSIHAG